MGKFYGLRGTRLNVTIGFIAGLDFLLFGYDQGVTGGLLKLASFERQFPDINEYQWQCSDGVSFNCPQDNPQANESKYQQYANYQAITVSAYNLGCFVGACLCIWVGNFLGRKRTIFVGSIIMTIGAAIQASAFTSAQLISGRIITGIGNGLNTSTVPTWQSETSKSHRRGQLVMLEGSLITAGICISYWIDFGFYYIGENSVAWRFPLAFQAVFALIIFSTILGLPESPRWLILKGRDAEALDVLSCLNDLPPDDKYIQNEFEAVKDTVLEMSKGNFSDLFTMDRNRHFHRVVLAYVNQMFQQISGINLITYYAPVIYTTIGLSGWLPSFLTAWNGTEYLLASFVAIAIVEKVGRRKLMLFGAAGMSLGMVALTAATHSSNAGDKKAGVAAAVFLFVFNTFFAIGWLGMTWLYPAEIVPLRIRAPANALSTSANWLFNFMVVMIAPPAFANIGYQTYIIFAVINAFIFPTVYFFYPETAYRSLEEMDAIFAKSNWLSVVSVAAKEPHRYDKDGNMVIAFDQTEEGQRRRSSLTGAREKAKQSISDGNGEV